MAGIWRNSFSALACFLIVASTAHAFGSRVVYWPTAPSTSYYWVPPVYYYCPPGPTVLPVPDAKKPPQSSSDARPTVITTRSPGSNEGNAPSKERCRVGFWNLTGRDVALTVGGKTVTLAKNQALTVDLGREFSWQVAGRGQHLERVPDGQSAFEVVVRE